MPCVVVDDDLHAELAMIDENLCRAELSPAGRAQQTARFTAETATAIYKSESAFQRDAERDKKVRDEALTLLRGTALDAGLPIV